MRYFGLLGILAALALFGQSSDPARAQAPGGAVFSYCYTGSGALSVPSSWTGCPSVTSVSASISGFHPELALAPLAVTTSSGTSGTFTAGKIVVVSNVGTTNTAYCLLGVVATTQLQPIAPNGGWFAFTSTSETAISCITSTSTTTVNILVGTGLPAGTGGGGGGSGGGGAITAAINSYAAGALSAGSFATGAGVDGWYLTDGAIADAAVTAGATGSNSAKLRAISRDIGTIATNSALPLPTQSVGVPIGGLGLCDGANSTTNPCTTMQTVLAASTAAAAANKPAVVALHPSSATPAAANPYPFGATPYTATATGTTGATTATLTGASSVTTYLCGFSIRANATAAATGNATVTGVITATLNFTQWTAPNASGLGITEMIFSPCIPASATNTSVAVVSAAPGTGGVVSVTAWGYKL